MLRVFISFCLKKKSHFCLVDVINLDLVLVNNNDNSTNIDAVHYFTIINKCSQTAQEKFALTQYVFILVLK